MTKEYFIKKYIYGIGNDALTDNQEAIDMAKDLDRYLTEQLRQYNVVGRSEQFICHSCNTKHSGKNDDQLHEVCKECFSSI